MDVVIIGAGIMSATLGALLTELEPDWHVTVVERLAEAGQESSHAWHNSGTGHAGLCEFNYTPHNAAGIDVAPAIRVGERFAASLRFWAHLAEQDVLAPDFVKPVPHMGFGRGEGGVAYLRARHEALRYHPLFTGLTYSEDRTQLAEWLPLVFEHRDHEPVAVTRAPQGTDVDYGLLSRRLLAATATKGATIRTSTEVTALRRKSGRWHVRLDDGTTLQARFVFVGAGGGTLPLLRSAGLPEVRGLGGFPISGQFLRTSRPVLVAKHHAKLYGHAEPDEPTLSIPHLDRRVVAGREHLMFGPFAAFSPRFLVHGRRTDLVRSLGGDNLPTLLAAVRDNRPMVSYLLRQLATTKAGRLAALRRFVPAARAEDWELVTAGQRVQVLKRTGGRGTLTGFGTEVVVAGDGTLAGLLGASPGASSAVADMVDVLGTCFPDRMPDWAPRLHQTMPLPRARTTLGLP